MLSVLQRHAHLGGVESHGVWAHVGQEFLGQGGLARDLGRGPRQGSRVGHARTASRGALGNSLGGRAKVLRRGMQGVRGSVDGRSEGRGNNGRMFRRQARHSRIPTFMMRRASAVTDIVFLCVD